MVGSGLVAMEGDQPGPGRTRYDPLRLEIAGDVHTNSVTRFFRNRSLIE